MWLEVTKEKYLAVVQHADKSRDKTYHKKLYWRLIHFDANGKRLGHREEQRGKVTRYFIVVE
jgi:hypothetical protein